MNEAFRRDTRSSSLALGALFAGLLMLGIAFAGFFIWFADEETFLREADAAIEADLRAARLALASGEPDLESWLASVVKQNEARSYYGLTHGPASNNDFSGDLPSWPDREVHAIQPGLIEFPVRVNGDQRVLVARILTVPNGRSLLVGRDVTELVFVQWFAQTFGWVMIGVFLIFAVASILVGLYVANRMNRIADIADDIIDTGNLAARVPIDSSWDDLSKLSSVLNRLLAELESTMQGIKTVADSIAHDLRTPLTRLKGRVEAMPESGEKDGVLRELDTILSVFNSLLRITAIENEKRTATFEVVNIAEVLKDVVEMYEPVAADKSVQLSCDISDAFIRGDRNLLFQLFSNVLDNAVKFTPSQGRVLAFCNPVDDDVVIKICDSGPGIPAEERERVLRRFYRLDKSRSAEGNGLGLAMVAAVVALHDGALTFDEGFKNEDGPGLCCEVRFPRRNT